jgi:LPS-assembly protein
MKIFFSQVPIILLGMFCIMPNIASARSKTLQLKLGDSVSVFSEKAYRKNNGTFFEAVGNVVILFGNETLYAEKASMDMQSGTFELEGSVRLISQGLAIHGSYARYTGNDDRIFIRNARVTTEDFSIIAAEITRISPTRYQAKKAEYTTCKDCTESWSVYGEELDLTIGKYAHLKHAFTKVKGINVLYFPYLVLPVKNQRESGILFPRIYTRFNEGVSYEQPIYWAINQSQDMTVTPTFLGNRGFGHELEYRHRFREGMWLEFNDKTAYDAIYLPGKTDQTTQTDQLYTRFFFDLEGHMNWNHDINQHFKFVGLRDLDMLNDYNFYMDERLLSNDTGLSQYFELRRDLFTLTLEGQYRRNFMFNDPIRFDDNYVQVLPSIKLSTRPLSIMEDLYINVDGDHTIFKQNKLDDTFSHFKNVARTDTRTEINWNIGSWGPLNFHTEYALDYQHYRFLERDDPETFEKFAGVLTTEMSFGMQRIFGLAYNKEINEKDYQKYMSQTGPNTTQKAPISDKKKKDMIGKLPDFKGPLTEDNIVVAKNSYRHSQEFRLIHYMILNSNERGNSFFDNQIEDSTRWFDYRDAVLSEIDNSASNATRINLPLENTLEFQWNNSLTIKRPKSMDVFQDRKYLRDNFTYRQIGYFNISQGLDFAEENVESLEDRLTRLYADMGFSGVNWSVSLREYYFHQTSDQILSLNFQRRIETLNLLFNYQENSFPESNKRILKYGFQIRPVDIFGFSLLQEYDLRVEENIRTVYQADFMPLNNCWIFNINYRDSLVEKRFAFNFIFNFGDDNFSDYRNNFWRFDRIGQGQ